MFDYRITKYDPRLRNELGYFSDLPDWTSNADIGKTFNGAILNTSEYLLKESLYIAAIERIFELCRVDSFTVSSAKRSPSVAHIRDRELRAATASLMRRFLPRWGEPRAANDVGVIASLILRECMWARLVFDGGFIHFGYDFYMYARAPIDCFKLGARPFIEWRPGLYIEPFLSPYIETFEDEPH
jgi:hypothetical protein